MRKFYNLRLITRGKILLTAQFLFSALMAIFLVVYTQEYLLGILFFSGSCLLAYMIFRVIYLPNIRREETIQNINERDIWEIIDNENEISDPVFNRFRSILKNYGHEIIREHSVNILDKQAQINALQSQINPHFLYNTLESIRGQALIEGNKEIASIAETLAVFFRYNISQKGYLVTLREEINNIKNYFKIQEYRFEDRFTLELNIDESEGIYDCYIPKLTIQPIVENAIFHGLETKGEKGKVVVKVDRTDNRIIIVVSDDGVGINIETLNGINHKLSDHSSFTENENVNKSTSSGIALINVNKRIELVFGQDYGLQVYSTQGLGTDVEITLPFIKDKSDFDAKLFKIET